MNALESLWLLGWLLALLGAVLGFFLYTMGRATESELEACEAQLAEESKKARRPTGENGELRLQLKASQARHESRERHVSQCAEALGKIALADSQPGTAVALPGLVLTPHGQRPVAWLVHLN